MRTNKTISKIVLYAILFWILMLVAMTAAVSASTKVFQKPSMTCYDVLTNNDSAYTIRLACYDSQLPVVCYINVKSISCIKY